MSHRPEWCRVITDAVLLLGAALVVSPAWAAPPLSWRSATPRPANRTDFTQSPYPRIFSPPISHMVTSLERATRCAQNSVTMAMRAPWMTLGIASSRVVPRCPSPSIATMGWRAARTAATVRPVARTCLSCARLRTCATPPHVRSQRVFVWRPKLFVQQGTAATLALACAVLVACARLTAHALTRQTSTQLKLLLVKGLPSSRIQASF